MEVKFKFAIGEDCFVWETEQRRVKYTIKAAYIQSNGKGGILIRYEMTNVSGLYREIDIEKAS